MIHTVVPSPTGGPLPAGSVHWKSVPALSISAFHPESSAHRPRAEARIVHYPDGLNVLFTVFDQYVICRNTGYQSLVSRDSCVEFFVRPFADKGYFNFEMNCGGSLLLYYIEDPTPAPPAFFTKFAEVPADLGAQVKIEHSAPAIIDPEITDPYPWSLCCTIPYAVMESFVGSLKPASGDAWGANFFKGGGQSSHPHWGAWADLGPKLRFHQPDRFGQIRFA